MSLLLSSVPNLNIQEGFYLLKTKSYVCLTERLKNANDFIIINCSLPKEDKLKDLLGLFGQIVKTFCDKANNLEVDEERLLIEVFKVYRACVAEIRVRNILIDNVTFLLEIWSLLTWQEDTELRSAIMQFLTDSMYLCTTAQCDLLEIFFVDDIFNSLRRRWCLRESSEAFNCFFLLGYASLGYKDYELILILHEENPELESLQSIVWISLRTEDFWRYFSKLEIKYRVLALKCAFDISILLGLPNNSLEVIVDCFLKCNFTFYVWSEANRLKIKEAHLLLTVISILIAAPGHSQILLANSYLLFGCAAFYNKIYQFEKTRGNSDLYFFWSTFIELFYAELKKVIISFSEDRRQDVNFLSALVD